VAVGKHQVLKFVGSEAMAEDRPALSIVAPCFNEEATLPVFVNRVLAAVTATGAASFELLLVDDGSRDATWEAISALADKTPGIVGVSLSRNYGHQLAASAGLSLARGERVLLIDADLQDPPELMVEMMARMDEGFDVVYARRRTRAKESPFKLATASAFYRLLGSLSEVSIPADVGDFRLMSRRIVERLNAMPEQDRFIRGMVAWLGGRQTEVLYDRDPRFAGETGYTLAKMVRLATTGITSFSTAPLKLAICLALTGMVVALAFIIYILVGFLAGRTIPGWTSMGLMVAFFGVGQLFCLAIIGAYLGRVFVQVKGRPLYFVDRIVTSRAEADAGAARGVAKRGR
jgi:polyisoprenyl-phosphate glycosyltransferase